MKRRSLTPGWLKPLVLLVGLVACFHPRPAFATPPLTFSTTENTSRTYNFTAAESSIYDPLEFGVYGNTACGSGSFPTAHGGSASFDGSAQTDIQYTPATNFVGTDTFSFYGTNDGASCTNVYQAIVTVYGPVATVTSIAPTFGPTAGGTVVAVSGSSFTGATAVKFGTLNATSFTVNSATQISATAPAASAATVDVTVVNATGTSSTIVADRFTYVAPLSIVTTTLPLPVYGAAYSQTIATTGGTGPITFSRSAGALPAGLALSSAGLVHGTPTSSGAYSFTVQAVDANSNSTTNTYSGTIAPRLAIATTTLPTPVLNVAYSQTVATTNGTTPIAFSVTAGPLPAGLSINSATGVISGTPTAPGSYGFSVRAIDANSVAATQAYSGAIVASITIATTTLPTPVIGVAYGQTVSTTGGTAPISFALSAGILPTGLTLNAATGAITGTPTTAGAYSFTIRATDTNAITASQAYSGTIAATLAIGSANLATPALGVAYNQTVTTTGGTAPITFALLTGTLPAGLTLNSATGDITGMPTSPGAYSFSIRATDANAITASQAYSGTIATSLAIGSATLPTPALGVAYNQTILTTGGTAPIAFSITSGALPAGLSINASGTISGTPTTSGSYSFTVTVTDAHGITVSRTFSGTIAPTLMISSATLPTPVIGVAYTQTVTTTGGTAPITFALTAGTLPTGLTLDTATGVLSGTPTAAGAYTFTIRATDANAIAASQTYSGTIGAGLTISSATLPAPVIGVAYSQTVTTTGGTPPIGFALTAGALPAGLTLNTATGLLSGSPTTTGAYAFTIRATDANAITANQSYSGTIGAGLAITSATLPTPVIGVAYSQTVTTTGGTAPITFASTAGALPTGLALNTSTGAITGTPTTAGGYTFTIRATDAHAITASQTYSGTIGAGLTISSATLPTPVIGVAYSRTITTTGGNAPITFALAAGTLPMGLTLNPATGSIAGTPTAAGAYTFTIRATDVNAIAASQAYSGTIGAGVAITSSTLPTPVIGVAYSQTVTTTGGTAPITFASTAGALPTGLTLNTATGAITGTPTAAGTYTFTIRATDANALAASQAYSETIGAGLAISSATLPTPAIGVAYSQTVTTTGGTAPIAFSIATGTLPTGLNLNAATGAITGTPTSAGAYTFTIRATDSTAITASRTYSGTIVATLTIATTTLPAPVISVAYNQTITTTGGTLPITFSLTVGTLPQGLRLETATGALSGTPTTAGAYTFTIRAVDAAAHVATQSYSGTVVALPSLAGLAPNSGPTAGGTSVTITGTALTGATAVMFGSTPATSFTIVSASSIVATSPSGNGTAAVRVLTPAGTTPATAGATFTWAATPAVTSISPDSGPFAGGTVVTITGRGFTRATAVYFGSIAAATFSVTSDTSISATTAPASANAAPTSNARRRPAAATPGSGVTVTVVTAGGTSPAMPVGRFVFVPAVVPTIARLTPASGTTAGGTSVTITGSALTGATAVRFGNAAASFTVTNATSLVAIAPAGTGTVNVTVTTPGGTSAGTSAVYVYKAAATTVALTSSSNPAAARTPVTFTATVKSAGATPTGSVRFKDGATVIGTVALAGGVAEFATSALAIGTHAITTDYAGDARFAPSVSAALAQAIDVPADSQKLRALQLAASKLVAQASGQAISSAIDSAISDGFSGNTPLITPSTTGVKLNVAEAGSRHKATTQTPVGLPDASGRTKSHLIDAAAPPDTGNATRPSLPQEWLVWADVQRTGIAHTGYSAATTIYGDQINALAGVTRKVSPNLLVGVLGGYETFDYRSDALAGRLNGNGTTVGAYLGWKVVHGLRFDLAGAHSAVGYDGVAGTAAGAFTGSRWLVSSGLIGTYDAKAFAVEPSAKVYVLQESQSAYTDSLGTPQATSSFVTGRTSAGVKISTLPKSSNFIAPYAGFYGDYYFNGDNGSLAGTATAVPLAEEKILAGWSARALAGFAARLGDATTVTCEVEYGGIGSSTEIVKYRCGAGVPFLRSRRTDK